MKLRFTYLSFLALLFAVLFWGNSSGRANIGNNGNTGAPGELASCAMPGCHSGGSFGSETVIKMFRAGTTEEVTTYWPGDVYDMEVIINTSTAPAGYAFQMVSLFDADDSDVNAWSSPGTGVQIATASMTGRSYAEQTSTSASNSFKVQWTAPASGSGSVTFYAAGNSVNGNGNFQGDEATNGTLTISENLVATQNLEALGVSVQLFPNPVTTNVSLRIDAPASGLFEASLVNILGREISTQMVDVNLGETRLDFDVANLPKGVYLVRLSNESNQSSYPFLKY